MSGTDLNHVIVIWSCIDCVLGAKNRPVLTLIPYVPSELSPLSQNLQKNVAKRMLRILWKKWRKYCQEMMSNLSEKNDDFDRKMASKIDRQKRRFQGKTPPKWTQTTTKIEAPNDNENETIFIKKTTQKSTENGNKNGQKMDKKRTQKSARGWQFRGNVRYTPLLSYVGSASGIFEEMRELPQPIPLPVYDSGRRKRACLLKFGKDLE